MYINEIISAYNAAKETEARAKKEKEQLKKLIIDYSGSKEGFLTDEYIVTIETTLSERLDTKALYKDFPDIKKTYGKITESVSVDAIRRENVKEKTA